MATAAAVVAQGQFVATAAAAPAPPGPLPPVTARITDESCLPTGGNPGIAVRALARCRGRQRRRSGDVRGAGGLVRPGESHGLERLIQEPARSRIRRTASVLVGRSRSMASGSRSAPSASRTARASRAISATLRRHPAVIPCSASIASITCRASSHPATGRPTIALTVASPSTRGTVKSGIWPCTCASSTGGPAGAARCFQSLVHHSTPTLSPFLVGRRSVNPLRTWRPSYAASSSVRLARWSCS